jgi:tetratricopeptide (TPR) repeat protein
MNADDRLHDLAGKILDGALIDWRADTAGLDTESVEELRALAAVARLHRDLAHPAPETPWSAARRGAASKPVDARVQWGPLEVHEKIGSGAFGDVYRAWEPRLQREVALKLVPEDRTAGDGSPVIEEGRLLARVRHPNVLTVHGAERIDGRVGIWTELIGGETLAAEVRRCGPLPAAEAAAIGLDLARALAAVHAAGVLHRDVKAENVLRDPQGRVVLGDFGVGAAVDDVQTAMARQPAGTPAYLAPEVLAHGPASVASDLYSLGVVLYFLMTGAHPVRGRTLSEIRDAHAAGHRTPLSAASRALPDSFVAVVEALLDRDPDRRPASAAAVAAALQAWIDVHGRATPAAILEAKTRRHRQRRQVISAGVVAAAVLAATAIWLVKGNGGPVLPFEERDWILITPFENRTGEPILDGTIEFAFERELANSTFVNVVPRQRVEDSLALMAQPLDARIDAKLGREICLRDGGIRALVTGRVEKSGSAYLVTAQIVNPNDGVAVATLVHEAPSESQLLAAVREQAFDLRSRLGEALPAIETSRKEVAQVTTPSLRAWSLYSQAAAVMPGKSVVAEQFLGEALRADPDFPSALILMAFAMANQQKNHTRDEYLPFAERAFQLVDRVSLRERYFITASVHGLRAVDRGRALPDMRQELERAAAAYEALLSLQPDHPWAANNLQMVYDFLGRSSEADQLILRLADNQPRNFYHNARAARVLLRQGRVTEAQAYNARAVAVRPPEIVPRYLVVAAETRLREADAAWLQNDPRKTLQVVDDAAAQMAQMQPDELLPFTLHRVRLYLTLGRLAQAEAVARTLPDENRYRELALVLSERADGSELRDYLTQEYREPVAYGRVGFFIHIGALAEAERELDWLKQHANINSEFPDMFEGLLHQASGRPAQAIPLLERSIQNSRTPWGEAALLAHLQLAAAWEALGDLPQSIRVLSAVLERRGEMTGSGSSGFRWIAGRAELARLYRKLGRDGDAVVIESELRTLLALADPDHRVLVELRARGGS